MNAVLPFAKWCETFLTIEDRSGTLVPFAFLPGQVYIDDAFSEWMVVLKPRRIGSTIYYLGRLMYYLLGMGHEGVNGVVILHKDDVTVRTMRTFQYMIDNLPPFMRPEVKHRSDHEITFPKLRSQVFISTAGARYFGAGDDIDVLIASEIALWQEPQRLLGTILPALTKRSWAFKETTPEPGYAQDMWEDANALGSSWVPRFVPWYYSIDYVAGDRDRWDDILDASYWPAYGGELSDREQALKTKGLGADRIRWRRITIRDLAPDDPGPGGVGEAMFLKYFPEDPVSCFMGVEGRPALSPALIADLMGGVKEGRRAELVETQQGYRLRCQSEVS